MKVEFKSSFARDLKKIGDTSLHKNIQAAIEQVSQAQDLRTVTNLKPLGRSAGRYYRIKLGDYRIGLIVAKDVVTFVRFLHRKEIYRYFP